MNTFSAYRPPLQRITRTPRSLNPRYRFQRRITVLRIISRAYCHCLLKTYHPSVQLPPRLLGYIPVPRLLSARDQPRIMSWYDDRLPQTKRTESLSFCSSRLRRRNRSPKSMPTMSGNQSQTHQITPARSSVRHMKKTSVNSQGLLFLPLKMTFL